MLQTQSNKEEDATAVYPYYLMKGQGNLPVFRKIGIAKNAALGRPIEKCDASLHSFV